MPSSHQIIKLAIPIPLLRFFDYKNIPLSTPKNGTRVSAPFGHQKALMGIVIGQSDPSEITEYKLKPIHQILDPEPALDQELLLLCQWCADYYHYPLGEVCHLALPALLRKPVPMPVNTETVWTVTEAGAEVDLGSIKRAPKQQQALTLLQNRRRLSSSDVKRESIGASTLKALSEKAWISKEEVEHTFEPLSLPAELLKQSPLKLTQEQQHALDAIATDCFKTYLIEGVTGSGKTEVYLQAITKVLEEGRQVLVLVPEIGLTPQTLSRFEARFNRPIAALHSGLTDKQRFDIWQKARNNRLSIVIGTRSSIFTPLPNLGLIVIDEEHDLSYKQQEGVRYSARDLAIVRAQKLKIPLILGTATPALESLHNALAGRYQHLRLLQRANNLLLPNIRCVDSSDSQLADSAKTAIQQALQNQQQVLIFINRRGYAPTLICQDCGWISQCLKCDNRMTLHLYRQGKHLHCHYCDTRNRAPQQCPNCHSAKLKALGSGTQRSEEELENLFPQVPVIRIDRDSVSRKGQLQAALDEINTGKPCILVGTQMLAKGHHFANLGLAVILGMDSAFFSSDFRGAERMGQLLTQVAGRVGRENQQGQVIIQTQFSDHPLLQQLLHQGYHAFAQTLLAERKLTAMPPWEHLAVIRCHSHQPEPAQQFLQQVRRQAESLNPPHNGLQYLGPFSASPEKRNNRYHYLLQIKAANRRERQQLLQQLCAHLEGIRAPKGLHWLVDVDPQDF